MTEQEIEDSIRLDVDKISKNGLILEHMGHQWQDNIRFVKKAVLQNPHAIQFASPCLLSKFEYIVIDGESCFIDDIEIDDINDTYEYEYDVDPKSFPYHSLQHIPNSNELADRIRELQLYAVCGDGSTIQYLTDPNEEIITAALSQNGLALEFIPDPSETHILIAIRQNTAAFKFVEFPCFKAIIDALYNDSSIFNDIDTQLLTKDQLEYITLKYT